MKKVDITKDFKNITKITFHYGLEKIVSIVYEKENKYEIGSKIYDKNNNIYASDYTSVLNNGKGLPIKVIHNVYDKNKSVKPSKKWYEYFNIDYTDEDYERGKMFFGNCGKCGWERLEEYQDKYCKKCGSKIRWDIDENQNS